jgi:cold shock protein
MDTNGMGREAGIIEMWNYDKGFGFVACGSGPDLFLHATAVLRGTRAVGRRVEFVRVAAQRGPRAHAVEVFD